MSKSRITFILFALTIGSLFKATAQIQDYTQTLDSLEASRPAMVDSTLLDKSIFNILPLKYNGYQVDVRIHQSQAILDAMSRHMMSKKHVIHGYRVRIYFDNKQDSRTDSEQTLLKFQQMYPGIPAYRSYQNPFFKVTAGDYRTKSEAMYLLNRIKQDFPSAFVVKDEIKYPL